MCEIEMSKFKGWKTPNSLFIWLFNHDVRIHASRFKQNSSILTCSDWSNFPKLIAEEEVVLPQDL